MERLVILNFASGDVDIYKVSPEADIDEDYLAQKLGLHTDECSWMFCQDEVNIEYHDEILE